MTDEPTKLFVYGIFLGESMRAHYGMRNPEYATVHDFVTVGNQIVEAVYTPTTTPGRWNRLCLTGLLVDYDPTRWEGLDRLEGGYDRIIITTTNGTRAYMYARHSEAFENQSTYPEYQVNGTVVSGR